ncbi:MAG: hypothetical protein LBC43_02990 [Bifidobacteriaceae bacterium]|nr:hypothetical protein [Bifidobacteriaceae bacterium]
MALNISQSSEIRPDQLLILAGKGEIVCNALTYLIEDLKFPSSNILAVPVQNDQGVDTWHRSLRQIATKFGAQVISPEDAYQVSNSIFLSLEFDKIIKPELFVTDKLFNIHFSKLPAYKGVYTSIFPILNGERESGVTLHCIDPGIDTGDIIAQKIFAIELEDTARSLFDKYHYFAFELFKEQIGILLSGSYKQTPQTPQGSTFYSRKAIDPFDYHVNLYKTSFEIHNQLRALIFPEYQLPQLEGIRICSSTLHEEFIGRRMFEDRGSEFVLSGIDGYKIIAQKA